MIQDFTYKQTQMPPDKYNSQVLIGNWYEERCDPDSKNSNFFVQNKFEQEKVYEKGILQSTTFQNSTSDIVAFQPNLTKDTVYTTIQMQEFKKPEEQKRTSVLLPHLTQKSYFDKHPEQLEEYRKKWTTAQHAWDRTYPGKESENVMIKK